MEKKKVMIGLSGGVDSAVAAYLLIQQGYEVAGGFMRNWDSFANNDFLGNPTVNAEICPQEQDYLDALRVAEKLGIKLYDKEIIEKIISKKQPNSSNKLHSLIQKEKNPTLSHILKQMS